MKNFRYFAQRYVDWVIRLGRVRFSLLGIAILAILAICIQILLSTLLSDGIHWSDIARSITFGLFTAPFVIYFFTLLVERLERSRLELSKTLARLEKNSRDKSTLLATISHVRKNWRNLSRRSQEETDSTQRWKLLVPRQHS